jgi:hypothetical protein
MRMAATVDNPAYQLDPRKAHARRYVDHMPTQTPLLLDLAGVARLAGVQRPVASMWRTRFGTAPDPFPAPAQQKTGRPFFDAMSVAQWLVRTEHGNNPDAVADAAAAAAPAGFGLAVADHVACVDALLALQAVTGEQLTDTDVATLADLARSLDPHDSCLVSEVTGADPAWIAWAEMLTDAAYSPLEASRLLERRHAATRSAAGSAGPLTTEGDALLVALGTALAAGREPELVIGAGIPATPALDLFSRLADADISVGAGAEDRAIFRRLLLEGLPLPTDGPSHAPSRLTVVRMPSTKARHPSQMLRALDELALTLRDDDRALVLAPAGVLTGALDPADELTRADVLRSGRVRAVVRLPSGLVASAPREALALWVLGRETGDVPVSERFTAVADLTDATLTAAARGDLAADVVAALGSAFDVRAHAFRFARLVRTTSLLAARGALIDAATRPPAARSAQPDLPALLDRARARVPGDLPTTAPTEAPASPFAPATIEALIAEHHVRVVPGTRLTRDEYSPTGLVVVGADDLDRPSTIGERRVDPLVFAERHPSARLTQPGDVIFRTSPTAKAWVDADGARIVAHPARVLRIDPADPGGLVPELAAADIDGAHPGPGSWRRWRLRRVAPSIRGPLRAALTELARRRRDLEDRLAALEDYTTLLTAGVASGAVALTSPDAADAASDSA